MSIICINQWNLKSFTIDFARQDIPSLIQEIAEKQHLPPETLRLTQNGKSV
jgi:hypothetical protein